MSRNADQWMKPLQVPADHYVSSRIYTDPEILEKERSKIFGNTWKFTCHESELPNVGDWRTSDVAGTPIVIFR